MNHEARGDNEWRGLELGSGKGRSQSGGLERDVPRGGVEGASYPGVEFGESIRRIARGERSFSPQTPLDLFSVPAGKAGKSRGDRDFGGGSDGRRVGSI
jgi:hypothetical protein